MMIFRQLFEPLSSTYTDFQNGDAGALYKSVREKLFSLAELRSARQRTVRHMSDRPQG